MRELLRERELLRVLEPLRLERLPWAVQRLELREASLPEPSREWLLRVRLGSPHFVPYKLHCKQPIY